ncbi:MAG: FAD-dependent oxidoreductase [Bacteroidales bacterium]|nr:FAD-dependent oxidoreductase [Bacteroidales bacterium]
MKKLIISTIAALLSVCAAAQAESYDLVVYGGTSSGVIAAYTAAREGLSVALVERTAHVGGLTTSGIGNVDIGWATTVGGYTAEFLRTVGAHYGTPHKMQIALECKIAEQVFNDMLSQTGVKVIYGTRLQEKDGVRTEDGRIVSISLENGLVLSAPVFIDSSYEGDLMAQAGVSYTVGRESREQYGESSAGVSEYKLLRAYTPDELAAVRKIAAKYPLDVIFEERVTPGSADHKSQAYVYRLTVTDNPDNQVPFYKPDGYDPERYFNVLFRIQRRGARRFGQILTLYKLPNSKYDLNHMDLVNAAWNYPEGSYAQREALDLYHRRYQEGFLYFLGHDPRVPEELRNDVLRYGYAKDEYVDNDNWPYQLYIREGRRMQGDFVMTQHDAWENHTKEDAVAIGSYFLDCHIVSSIVTKRGMHLEEGNFEYTPYKPYELPYRIITPRKAECSNLLVPVCMSASHVICASLRMEPVYMMLGQAAGDAALLAIKAGAAVQDIDTAELQKMLKAQKQIIHFKIPLGMYLTPEMFDGIVIDDSELGLEEGFWSHSTSQGPFMKYDYRFAPVNPKGGIEAVFPVKVPAKGRYEVQIMYSASGNRVTAADVTVVDKKGSHPCSVDMTKSPRIEGSWHSLGVYNFDPKKGGKVVFTNKGESGVVVVDAVRFIKK